MNDCIGTVDNYQRTCLSSDHPHSVSQQSVLLRGVVGEGLAKLLLSGRIISQKLLVRLLLLWYNPALQDEDGLRSMLGIFFPTFASSDR